MWVTLETSELEQARAVLAGIKHGPERACVRVINRAAVAARKVCAQKIRETYAVKSSKIKSAMNIKKANFGRLSAAINTQGPPLDIMDFKTSIRKKGVFIQVKKGGWKELPHSFYVPGAGIFHRVGAGRLPINREFGPSIPQMAGNPEIGDAMSDIVQQTINNRLEHEIWAVGKGYIPKK